MGRFVHGAQMERALAASAGSVPRVLVLTVIQAFDGFSKLLMTYVRSTIHARDAKHRRVNDQIRASVKGLQWGWNAVHDLLPHFGQAGKQTVA